MNFRLVFTLMFVCVAAISGTPVKPKLELVSIIELEEPCVRQGGICLRIDDCAPGNLVQIRDVLCPQQRHLNVECCYIK